LIPHFLPLAVKKTGVRVMPAMRVIAMKKFYQEGCILNALKGNENCYILIPLQNAGFCIFEVRQNQGVF
jgi:hypothetical protein